MERLRRLALFGRVVGWDYGETNLYSLAVSGLTVKLAHWLSNSAIFGAHDKIVEDLTEAWWFAKIGRLVGSMEPPVNPDYAEEFAVGEYLEKGTFADPYSSLEIPFIAIGTLRHELDKVSSPTICPGLLDFIDFLLVLDHGNRPTTVEALKHPYLNNGF